MTPLQIMEGMRAEDLVKVAKVLRVGKGLTKKAEVIAALSLVIRNDLPRVLEHCSKEEKLALAEAAFNGGVLDPVVFKGKYGINCPIPTRFCAYGQIPSLLGLVMTQDRFGTFLVAEEVAEGLRSLLPVPKAAAVETMTKELPETHQDGQPVRVFSGEGIVFHELRRVLGLAQSGKLLVTAKRGTPTDATVRQIGEVLIQADLELDKPKAERDSYYEIAGPVRAHAWGVIVQQCGWCKPSGSKLGLTRQGRAMLAEGNAAALEEGFQRLLKDDCFDELNRIDNILGQTGKGKRSMTRPSYRKVCITDSMVEWPTGDWITFEDAFQFVKASSNSFQVSRNNWDLYFCVKQYGSLGYDFGDDGCGLERQYMRAFLAEILATLGIIDIAYVSPHLLWPEFSGAWGTDDMAFCSRYDGLLHVRLTGLGAYCLGSASTYEAPKSETKALVKFQPDFELLIADDAAGSPTETARLEMFSTPVNERIWKIHPPSILNHLETGGSMEEIRKEINSVSNGEVPEAVTNLLDKIDKKASALKVDTPCILIKARDEATAELIALDPRAARYCLPAGDRHLVVAKNNETAFRAAVKELGYVLPK